MLKSSVRIVGFLALTGTLTTHATIRIIGVILHCVTLTVLGDPTVPAHRINLDDVIRVCSSFNIATDVAILLLPMPELWEVETTNRKRLQLIYIFLLGNF